MSEKMLRVSLNELKTIRVKCMGKLKVPGESEEPCGMTYEIALGKAWAFFSEQKCPRCQQSYINSKSAATDELSDPLKFLLKATDCLKRMGGQLEVEFDVRLKE